MRGNMAGLKQKECKVKRRLAAFPNDIVASTTAQVKYLGTIPEKELKETLLLVISCNGLTFSEQAFIHTITENWYKNKYDRT